MADPQPQPWRTAHVALATAGQTHAKVAEIVASILGRAGCVTCGRLIKLDVEFAVDPGPELTRSGAVSLSQE
jgi:hypothetical protein